MGLLWAMSIYVEYSKSLTYKEYIVMRVTYSPPQFRAILNRKLEEVSFDFFAQFPRAHKHSRQRLPKKRKNMEK